MISWAYLTVCARLWGGRAPGNTTRQQNKAAGNYIHGRALLKILLSIS